MKNKKGFTLIEIIICIALIAIIGTTSVFGIKTIKNNIRIDKLEQITEKALVAAKVYIESNKETYNQLYTQKNGVVIPIKLLVNEGLLRLDNTDLTDNDIENEYVISALSSTTPNSDCTEINETTSWSSESPIYLCINSATGSANLSIVDPTITNNSIKIKEPYYFKGYGTKNWIKYNSTKYRILSVESDDSLILYHSASFGNAFNNLTQPISTLSTYCYLNCPIAKESPTLMKNSTWSSDGYALFESSYTEVNGESSVDCNDVAKTSICSGQAECLRGTSCPVTGWMGASIGYDHFGGASSSQYNMPKITVPTNARKIHLKSCMKITGGSGDYGTPYILENKC